MKQIIILALGVLSLTIVFWLSYTEKEENTPSESIVNEAPVFVEETANDSESEYNIDDGDFVNAQDILPNTTIHALSQAEIDGIVLMREEEKLARDVYAYLGEMWNTPIFSNIARSEQTHMNAMAGLLALYDISDPVQSNDPGVFTSTQMQTLYSDLTKQGSVSREDAFKVGATIEDLDIYDLDRLLNETSNSEIIRVYENLQKGSRNHLRAFNRQLERSGTTYTPAYISTDEFVSIISSAQERGTI